jgi:hypothetical protein
MWRSMPMWILGSLKPRPAGNSLAPFHRRARIRRFIRLLRWVAWVLIILVALAVAAVRLTTCAKSSISVQARVVSINASSRMSSDTFHAESTAGVDVGNQ